MFRGLFVLALGVALTLAAAARADIVLGKGGLGCLGSFAGASCTTDEGKPGTCHRIPRGSDNLDCIQLPPRPPPTATPNASASASPPPASASASPSSAPLAPSSSAPPSSAQPSSAPPSPSATSSATPSPSASAPPRSAPPKSGGCSASGSSDPSWLVVLFVAALALRRRA